MGLLVVAIHDDTEGEVREAMGADSLLPVMLDPGDKVAASFGIHAPPAVVFVDSQGRIAGYHQGGITAAELAAAAPGME